MSVLTSVTGYETSGQAGDFLDRTEPFELFNEWFADAERAEVNDPNAMALATVDETGLPNVRVVLLKGLDDVSAGNGRGFVFYTNHRSRKGIEILGAGKAALNFHWKSLRRQVRVRGLVAPVSAEEADAYFASRPRGSQVGAWASQQSQPMPTRDALTRAVGERQQAFGESTIPRPSHWSGFRVTPLSIEFWHDRPYRLHDRLVFTRPAPDAAWARQQLFP